MSGCGSATDSFAVHYDSLSWSPDGKSIAFGASGDLTKRKLLPALYNLKAHCFDKIVGDI